MTLLFLKNIVVFSVLVVTLIAVSTAPAMARTEYGLLTNGQLVACEAHEQAVMERAYQREEAAGYRVGRPQQRQIRDPQQTKTWSREAVVAQSLDRQTTAGQRYGNDIAIPLVREVADVDDRDTNKMRREYFDAQEQYFVQPSNTHKAIEAELGVEAYAYQYKETDAGEVFMKDQGAYAGLAGALVFSPDLGNAILPDMFRLEARFAGGRVDYSSDTENYNGLNDYMYELRVLAGKRIVIDQDAALTPYLGVGWRYLNNGFEDVPATDTSYSGYNRESRYLYAPVGIHYETAMADGWRFKGNLEFDYLIQGEQTTHLEDGRFSNGINTGFSTVTNDQNMGYGVRGSLRFARDFTGSRTSFFVEPFYRYWHIDQSDTRGSYSSTLGIYFDGYEPENTTQELGLKAGVLF